MLKSSRFISEIFFGGPGNRGRRTTGPGRAPDMTSNRYPVYGRRASQHRPQVFGAVLLRGHEARILFFILHVEILHVDEESRIKKCG